MMSMLLRPNTTVKFFLFLLGVSIVPLLVVGMVGYHSSRAVLKDEVRNYTQALLIQQRDYLALLLGSIESLMANVSGIENIKEALNKQEVSHDTYTQLATHAQVGYILNGYLNLDGLVSIDIFTTGGTHYHVGDTLSTENIDEETYQRIYNEVQLSDRLVLWTGIENNINIDSNYKKVVTAAKLLTAIDAEHLQEQPAGLLLVTYDAHRLHAQFSNVDLGKDATMLIVDGKNRLVYHPDKQMLGSRLAAAFVAQLIGEQGSFVTTIEGRATLVTYTRSGMSDWVLINLVAVTNLTSSADTIMGTMLLVSLVAFGFILLAAMVVNRTTVEPIRRVTQLFQAFQAGTLDQRLRLKTRRTDEIGELMQWFNAFLDGLEARQATEAKLKYSEAERAALQEQVIAAQQATIRELSTPLIPISQHAVIMPLIGAIDSIRAQQVLETLVEGVVKHQADLAILDITGVQLIDTYVSDVLIRATRAVKLLGAQVVLTGIQPQMAAALVQSGIDLRGITTYSTLQSAIAHAFAPVVQRNGHTP